MPNVLHDVIPGVPSIDSLAWSVAAAVLVVAGLTAVAVPAMRAARVSPAEALRRE